MALDRLDQATHARKALVLLSDGGDNLSKATLDEVLAHARTSNVAIYAIGIYDVGAPDTKPGVLKRLRPRPAAHDFFRGRRLLSFRRALTSRGKSAAGIPSATSRRNGTAVIMNCASRSAEPTGAGWS